MKESKEKTEVTIHGDFKTVSDAWKAADATTPATIETLVQVNNMLNYEVTTLEDFRWFVLMNHVRSIDAALHNQKNTPTFSVFRKTYCMQQKKYLVKPNN